MESEIVEHIELFKEKVDNKTLELFEKNQQIERQKDKLQQQVKISNDKNKDLLDGMRYAWRIQQALIPDSKKVKKHVQKGFVFFQPRDIVSGDIYWTYKQKNIKEDESIFSVIDCTGHGVPGAFMSILAVNAINYAVLNKRINKPNTILQVTNNYVFRTLEYYASGTESSNVKDGMDMLLCKLNRQKKTIEYSGANRPLFIVRKKQSEESYDVGLKEKEYKIEEIQGALLFEVKPTKRTVGTQTKQDSKMFENKQIRVEEGDMIYLTTDGYADQFGGPKGKKFMQKRLKNLLALMYELDEEEQKSILQETLLDWKRNEEQVDDISIMGIRV